MRLETGCQLARERLGVRAGHSVVPSRLQE